MINNKKLLLLGGSRNMKEVLDAAHSMGYIVGITDWYDTYRSPIKLLADEYFNVSITDNSEIDKLIRDNNYNAVLTGYTDSYLSVYADICERNQLHCYGSSRQFGILTDKSLYKTLFEKFRVPIIEQITFEEIDEQFCNYPIILKPVDGSGGKGIEIVNDYFEFEHLLNNYNLGDIRQNYIIEPYIEDRKEMTAFFLFIDGECYVSGTANRFLSTTLGTKIGLPMFYSMPSSYDNIFREHTAPPMIRLFKELGLMDGMLFAQCIIYDGKPRVYDVGYRLTGTLEYKLQEKMYGFNPLKMIINHSINGTMIYNNNTFDGNKILNNSQYGFNVTILGKPGMISLIRGEERVRRIPDVIDIAFKMVEGEKITNDMVGTLGQIICRVFFVSESLERSGQVLTEIYESIIVQDEYGNDMIVDRMDISKLLETYHK